MANKKKLKSWQRRKKRRRRAIIRLVVLCLILAGVFAFVKASMPYETVDLSDYVTYEYSGYNTKGSVEAAINDELASNLMHRIKSKYDSALIKSKKVGPEDYNAFYNSLTVIVNAPEYLSNGSMFSYRVNYNKALAKKLKLKVKEDTKEVMASGLPTAAVIRLEDLFSGISFTYEGVSPSMKATMTNTTNNPYLTDVEFVVEGEQEYYSEGDVIRVRALYDEAVCLEKHFVIDADKESCYKDFIVEAKSHYIRSAAELTPQLIDAAVSAANNAFTTKTAKEFGVRVYFEAGIEPVYVNKESTFSWVSYGPISAYLKVANSDIAGKNSNNYNDLDIIYNCIMTQADGRSTNVEAVVRFKDIVVNDDGTFDYNFNNPTISSCSHMDSRIKKNVIANYEKDHTIEKISLN